MTRCVARWLSVLLVFAGLVTPSNAEDRKQRVQNDRSKFAEDPNWIYNDLENAFDAARESGKPLLVVFRCVP